MKLVLRDDVKTLGRKGDVVDVADGYARNYLVPRGFAIPATEGAVRQAEAMRRNREIREIRDRESAQEAATRVSERTIQVRARAGEAGRLFGSVTAADLVDAVRAQAGVELDRRKVLLDEPLKALGTAEVVVRLHADVEATLHVEIVAE